GAHAKASLLGPGPPIDELPDLDILAELANAVVSLTPEDSRAGDRRRRWRIVRAAFTELHHLPKDCIGPGLLSFGEECCEAPGGPDVVGVEKREEVAGCLRNPGVAGGTYAPVWTAEERDSGVALGHGGRAVGR